MSLTQHVNKLADKLEINTKKYDDYNNIVSKVFIGNYHSARSKEFFQKHNIKAVLNCTKDLPNSFRSSADIEYMRIPIDDSLREVDIRKLIDYFPAATAFIDKHARIQKHNILVHCVEGSQRSCAAVSAYLMGFYNMSARKAVEVVLTRRNKAFHHGSNVNFEKSLLTWSKILEKR